MVRLGIVYDLLARESEILHLKFWDAAFAMLKEAGTIEFVESGKMAGCWVMRRKEEVKEGKEVRMRGADSNTEVTESTVTEEEENNQDKIIVRSNGTVTYVG